MADTMHVIMRPPGRRRPSRLLVKIDGIIGAVEVARFTSPQHAQIFYDTWMQELDRARQSAAKVRN